MPLQASRKTLPNWASLAEPSKRGSGKPEPLTLHTPAEPSLLPLLDLFNDRTFARFNHIGSVIALDIPILA